MLQLKENFEVAGVDWPSGFRDTATTSPNLPTDAPIRIQVKETLTEPEALISFFEVAFLGGIFFLFTHSSF